MIKILECEDYNVIDGLCCYANCVKERFFGKSISLEGRMCIFLFKFD